ncbi:hypothetical protein Esti_000151 [Eimeria stiedai]
MQPPGEVLLLLRSLPLNKSCDAFHHQSMKMLVTKKGANGEERRINLQNVHDGCDHSARQQRDSNLTGIRDTRKDAILQVPAGIVSRHELGLFLLHQTSSNYETTCLLHLASSGSQLKPSVCRSLSELGAKSNQTSCQLPMCSLRLCVFLVPLASSVALVNGFQAATPNDAAEAGTLTAEQGRLSSVLQEEATESYRAGVSSLDEAANTTDLWNDSSEAANAKPQYLVQFSLPADLPPASSRRRSVWISALAALVLTAALARLYLGSPQVEADDQFVEDQLRQLQNLSAQAEKLSEILKDDIAAARILELRLHVTALNTELSERHEEVEEGSLMRSPWARRKEALMKKERLEEAQKVLGAITRVLHKSTWKRLRGKAHGVFGLYEGLAQHAAALTAVAESLKTEEAQVTSALVATVSRAVKQDVHALKTMLREGEKHMAFSTTAFSESAHLLEISVAFAEKVDSISLRTQAALARVEEWRGSFNTVVAMGALIEGVEVARQIDRLRLAAATLSVGDEEGDVTKGCARAQLLVEALLLEVQRESCPVKITEHLSRLKQVGQEAQDRFRESQKLAGYGSANSLVCHRRNIDYYAKVAKQEANAAALYGSLVHTLVTQSTAFARREENSPAWHTELTTSLGKVVLLSRRVADAVGDAREGADDTVTARSIAEAAVKAKLTKELRAEAYGDALEVVRAAATSIAWAQLDCAAQEAVTSVDRSLAFLKKQPKGAAGIHNVSRLLQDDDPKLVIRRYRSSTTPGHAKRHVLALLRIAKRLDFMQMSRELRWLRGSKEETVRRQ